MKYYKIIKNIQTHKLVLYYIIFYEALWVQFYVPSSAQNFQQNKLMIELWNHFEVQLF